MQPTKPQQFIVDYIMNNLPENVMVLGVPGAGKTALLSILASKFAELGIDDVLALTFSHDLAVSMVERLPQAKVFTTHAYMFQALKRFLQIRNIKPQSIAKFEGQTIRTYIDADLVAKEVKTFVKLSMNVPLKESIPADKKKEFYQIFFDIKTLVDKIRLNAYHYINEAPLIHEKFDIEYGVQTVNDALMILDLLSKRFMLRGTVDFNGMLYLPLIHPETHRYIVSPKVLLIDEANDTTKLLNNCYKIIGKNRVIIVGDKKQTIHIWAGTPRDCMDKLQLHFTAKELSYDFTFRVPKAMCKYLNDSGIDKRIKPYETNLQGSLTNVKYVEFLSKVYHGDMVLCRYNRGAKVKHTLQAISIDLILKGKKVALHGSTHIEDINELLDLTDEVKDFGAILPVVERTVLNTIAKEYTEYDLSKDNYRCKTLRENLESFKLYFNFYKKMRLLKYSRVDFIKFLNEMYEKSENAVQLYSGHRCKGLEAKRVYIFHTEALLEDITNEATTIDQKTEAHNLLLVMFTRSLDATFLVDCELPNFVQEPQ